jgi:hypothetical protein
VTKTLVPVTSAADSETVAPLSGVSLPNESLIKNSSFEEGNVTVACVENFETTLGDLNDTLMTGRCNYTVNLAGGNDEAIYKMAAKEGESDVYHGGAGVDTLTLGFTKTEWNENQAIQTDIAGYQAHLANGSSDLFEFTAFGLKVSEFEHLSVRIGDGDATDMTVMTVVPLSGMTVPNKNLIKNPSFEEGNLCARAGSKSWCIVDQNKVPSWAATGHKIELDVTVWPAFEGRVSVDLSPYRNSFLHQTVELVVGQDYVLTFALSSNTCGNGKGYYKIGTDSDREVKFTGIKKWQTIEAKFNATEVMTQIGFGSLSGNSCGPVIDDIKLLRDDTNIL